MTEVTPVDSSLVKLVDPHIAAASPLKIGIMAAINPVLGFIINHWKLVLLGVLLLIIYIEYDLIKHYKAEAAADQKAITTLTTSLATANKALADQNEEIQKAAKDNKNKQDQVDQLSKDLKKKQIADQKIIDALRNKPAGTTCKEALDFMNSYLGKTK